VYEIDDQNSNPYSTRLQNCLPVAYMELRRNIDARRQLSGVPSHNVDESTRNRPHGENLPQTLQTPVKRNPNSCAGDAAADRYPNGGCAARRTSAGLSSNDTTGGSSSGEYGSQLFSDDRWRVPGGGSHVPSSHGAAVAAETQGGTNRGLSHPANHSEQFALSGPRDCRHGSWNGAPSSNFTRAQAEAITPHFLPQGNPGSCSVAYSHGLPTSASCAFAGVNLSMPHSTVQGLHQQPRQMSPATAAWRPSHCSLGYDVPNGLRQQSVHRGLKQPPPYLAASSTYWRHSAPGQLLTDTNGRIANGVQRNPAGGCPLNRMSEMVSSAGGSRAPFDRTNEFAAVNTGLPTFVGSDVTRPWYNSASVGGGPSGNIWRAAGMPVDANQSNRLSFANNPPYNQTRLAGANEVPAATAGRWHCNSSMLHQSLHHMPPHQIGMSASDVSVGQSNCVASGAATSAGVNGVTAARHNPGQESSARRSASDGIAATQQLSAGGVTNAGSVGGGISDLLVSMRSKATNEAFEALNEVRDLFALTYIWLKAVRISVQAETRAGRRSQTLTVAETHLDDLEKYAESTADLRDKYRQLDAQRVRDPELCANIDWNFLVRFHCEATTKRVAFRTVVADVKGSCVNGNTLGLAEAIVRNASVLRDCLHSVNCVMSELVSFLSPTQQLARTSLTAQYEQGQTSVAEQSVAPFSGLTARRNSTDSGVSNSSPPVDDILPFGGHCLGRTPILDGLLDASADSMRSGVNQNSEAVSKAVGGDGARANEDLPTDVVPNELNDGSSVVGVELKAAEERPPRVNGEDDEDAESVFSLISDDDEDEDEGDVIVASSFKPTIKFEFQDFFDYSKVLEMAGVRLCPTSIASLKTEAGTSYSATPVASHDILGSGVAAEQASGKDDGRYVASNVGNTCAVPIDDVDRTAVVHVGTGASDSVPVTVSTSFVDSMLSMLSSRSVDDLLAASRPNVESQTEGSDVRDSETVVQKAEDGNVMNAHLPETNRRLTDTLSGDGANLEQLINEVIAGDAWYSYPDSFDDSPTATDVSHTSADASVVADPSPVPKLPENDADDLRYDLNRVKLEDDVSVIVEPYRVSHRMEVTDDRRTSCGGSKSAGRETKGNDSRMFEENLTVSKSPESKAGITSVRQNAAEVAATDEVGTGDAAVGEKAIGRSKMAAGVVEICERRAADRNAAGAIKQARSAGSTDAKGVHGKTMSSVTKFLKASAADDGKRLRRSRGSVPAKRKIGGHKCAFQAEVSGGCTKKCEPKGMTTSRRILQASFRRSPLTLLNSVRRDALGKEPRSEPLPAVASKSSSKLPKRPRMQTSGLGAATGRNLQVGANVGTHPPPAEGN
jgi:hypothetical protein